MQFLKATEDLLSPSPDVLDLPSPSEGEGKSKMFCTTTLQGVIHIPVAWVDVGRIFFEDPRSVVSMKKNETFSGWGKAGWTDGFAAFSLRALDCTLRRPAPLRSDTAALSNAAPRRQRLENKSGRV